MGDYVALARKFRPRFFKDVVGQSATLTALCNSLDRNKLHHAYLFSGTRGVGKTTIARIFAKALNCEKGDPVTSTPCGECPTCRAIEDGSFIDLIEIDAASKTKVEDTRTILDNVMYKPTSGRYKVYIIDEVHMLSKSSFNALLKTLEEPPKYVKFILATTDPQKIPVTILSRCLQFKLRALSTIEIVEKLGSVLETENISYQEKALKILAHAANGSMRDALSLTDQVVALSDGEVSVDNVINMIGTIDKDLYIELLDCVHSKDAKNIYNILNKIESYSPNYYSVMDDLASLLHEISMYQILGCEDSLLFSNDITILKNFSQKISPDALQLYYQITINGKSELQYAPTGRIAFDMTVLRMMAFVPVHPFSNLPINNNLNNNLNNKTEHNINAEQFSSAINNIIPQSIPSNSIDNSISRVQNNNLSNTHQENYLNKFDSKDQIVRQLQTQSSNVNFSNISNQKQQVVSSKQSTVNYRFNQSSEDTLSALNSLIADDKKKNNVNEQNIESNLDKLNSKIDEKISTVPQKLKSTDNNIEQLMEDMKQKVNTLPQVDLPWEKDTPLIDLDDLKNSSQVESSNIKKIFEVVDTIEIKSDVSGQTSNIVNTNFIPNAPLISSIENEDPISNNYIQSNDIPLQTLQDISPNDLNNDELINTYENISNDDFNEDNFSTLEPIVQENIEQNESSKMINYKGKLPFYDPNEYNSNQAIEYVKSEWKQFIDQHVNDGMSKIILYSANLEKDDKTYSIHINSNDFLLLQKDMRDDIEKNMKQFLLKDPQDKICFVKDDDCFTKSPNGEKEIIYKKLISQEYKKLQNNEKYNQFIKKFNLDSNVENFHLIKNINNSKNKE